MRSEQGCLFKEQNQLYETVGDLFEELGIGNMETMGDELDSRYSNVASNKVESWGAQNKGNDRKGNLVCSE